MKILSSITVLFLLTGVLLFSVGCDDSNYKSGIYWLEKENNPKMAARKFQQSLETNPKKWKTHAKLIEALALDGDAAGLNKQLRETLPLFPDCTRSVTFMGNATRAITQDEYNLLSAGIDQRHLEKMLGKKGDTPELLARMVITSCLLKDTVGTLGYYRRLLTALNGAEVPREVTQEMDFLIGPSRVEWETLEWKVKHDPDNVKARLDQLNAGIVFGDSAAITSGLRDLIGRIPAEGQKPDLAKRFGMTVNVDPFNSKKMVTGYDGSFSPDGKSFVYIRNRGNEKYPDRYIYQAKVGGGGDAPLLKGNQQRTPGMAMPVYSPDGNWIYYFGSSEYNWTPGKAGRFHLYRLKPRYGSSPQQLTDSDLLPAAPTFTKDGHVLLVRKDIGSTKASVEILELNPNTREIKQLSRVGEPVTGATFSPGSDSLIFTTDRGIFRRSVEGGNITVDLAWRGLSFPRLSPDGKYLVVYNQSRQLILVNRTNGNASFLGSTENPFIDFNRNNQLLVTRSINDESQIMLLDIENDFKDTQSFITAIK